MLKKLGLHQINANYSIFVTKAGIEDPIVSTFVNDIKIIGVKGLGFIKQVKKKLATAFDMVDIGPISFYLSLKVEKNRIKRILKLSQPAYVDKILAKYHLDQAKPCNVPMKEGILLPNKGSEASQAEREQYQGITGFLMFSMVETRPDIAFAISVVNRFAKNTFRQHTQTVKTIMRYLKATKSVGITYSGEERGRRDFTIKSYSKSDWAGDNATRKSTSGFVFMLNGGHVSWCTKKQATVALLLTGAKYVALTLVAKEVTWLRLLLTKLGLLKASNQYAKIKVIQGNTGTEQILTNIKGQEKEAIPSTAPHSKTEKALMIEEALPFETITNISLLLKGDNQGSIVLAHNPVFHA